MSGLTEARIACLGSGIMGGLLVKRLVSAEAIPAARIVCSDTEKAKLVALRQATDAQTTTGNAEAAASADVVIVAVPPPAVLPVLTEVAASLKAGALIISVAAGVTLSAMRRVVPAGVHLARVMPNTPSEIGAGMNTFVCEGDLPQQQRALLTSLLDIWGQSTEIDESALNASCALLAVGPTYLLPLAEQLMVSAEASGLSPGTARSATAQLFAGVGALLSRTDRSAKDLLNMISMQPMDAAAARKVIGDAYSAVLGKLGEVEAKLSG